MQRLIFTILLWLCIELFKSTALANSRPLISTGELESQIYQRINLEREKYGLARLNIDEQLMAIARGHSSDMAAHHFFSHINLQGEKPTDRALRQGWHREKQIAPDLLSYGVAENIFLTHLYDKIVTTKREGIAVKKEYRWLNGNQLAQTVVQGWMNSPQHRKIILSPQYDREGIGVFISGNDVYVTQNLF